MYSQFMFSNLLIIWIRSLYFQTSNSLTVRKNSNQLTCEICHIHLVSIWFSIGKLVLNIASHARSITKTKEDSWKLSLVGLPLCPQCSAQGLSYYPHLFPASKCINSESKTVGLFWKAFLLEASTVLVPSCCCSAFLLEKGLDTTGGAKRP